ncbi:ABC transporter ATP-binding protein [Evansella halocellulosilytica]|uniref:ABC transporter ATP-binding protein n=1 Tax=Evansella halocellulosilytica TaxID=2011013 RepID=UPI000BB79078|nr:ABC transporter ATP-binding protein [Evansella halocellulosilytica]
MINFTGVKKTFPDGTEAIKGIDFTVKEGDFFVLIGPSGCGKTTTMKMVNRLIDPTEGSIKINGENIQEMDIKKLRWNIGYVLQQIALFPHMTIEENIAVVPELKKWPKANIRQRVDELMSMVGLDLDTYRTKKPNELSGGQQQRVGVIRALAGDPDIILMDEPFSALDPISREQLQKDIRQLQKEIKKTILFVTHDMDEALALGDTICVMKEGGIVQIDTPEQLLHEPKDEFVNEFLGDRKDPLHVKLKHLLLEESHWVVSEEGLSSVSPNDQKFVADSSGAFVGLYNEGVINTDFEQTLHEDSTLRDAIRAFKKTDMVVLPVTRNDKLTGTVSLKDITFYLEGELHDGRLV